LRQLTAVELVQGGFADPVRLFIKEEPHSIAKCEKKRWRLISSVSIVDKLVEYVLFKIQNQKEIDNWRDIPSSPGFGFSQELVELLDSEVRGELLKGKLRSSDVLGFDFSQDGTEIDSDAEVRVHLGCYNPESELAPITSLPGVRQ
jgi:hypothetical protein